MSEHTPTPWKIGDRKPYVEIWGPMRIGASPILASMEHEPREANAAFIVKAVNNHEALLEFFKWAMREGPWDGGDLDSGSVQDKAEALGLIVKTQYDAEKHGVQSEFEHGDDWFEYAPDIRAPLISTPNT